MLKMSIITLLLLLNLNYVALADYMYKRITFYQQFEDSSWHRYRALNIIWEEFFMNEKGEF